MQNREKTSTDAQTSSHLPAQERVGLAVYGANAALSVSAIVAAEFADVRQAWMTQGGPSPDTLSIFAAAAIQTTSIRLGTAIISTRRNC